MLSSIRLAPDTAGKLLDALKVDVDNAFVVYTITVDDAAQVGGPLPEDWNEKSQLTRLNYESLADCIAEKFHCTGGLLTTLNPGIKLDGPLQVDQIAFLCPISGRSRRTTA